MTWQIVHIHLPLSVTANKYYHHPSLPPIRRDASILALSVYFGPSSSVSGWECEGWDGGSVGLLVGALHPTIGDWRSGRGDCIEFSVRNSPFGKTWHAMSFQNIMTCHIFSSHHTWLLCMGSLHRWFARLVSSISSSPSRILWPPSLFEWSLFKSFVLGLVPYTISC